MQVVITGGSRGIGAAAVRAFCRRGDAVTFFYKNSEAAALALSRETGAAAIKCDVADSAAVAAAMPKEVDLLINNAGIAHYGLLQDMTDETWRNLMAVNLDGAFYCTRSVLPGMIRRQSGAIINVSSMWGQVGGSCEVAYSASKGALLAFTKALAQEVGPSGVRVNAIAPGVIGTEMCQKLGQETLNGLADETPLGRIGTAEEVAEAMVYLADAKFVTGQVLGINGGFVIV